MNMISFTQYCKSQAFFWHCQITATGTLIHRQRTQWGEIHLSKLPAWTSSSREHVSFVKY